MATILQEILNFFFPLFCLTCRKPLKADNTRRVCPECWGKIKMIRPPLCQRCGRAMEREFGTCWSCKGKKFSFDRVWAVGRYDGILKELIHKFKFQDREYLYRPLGELMARYLADTINQKIDLVTSVPMSKERLRERGYNQASLLAGVIARETGIMFKDKLLYRQRRTRPQYRLSSEERKENLRGAFTLIQKQDVREQTVLVVDDIFTTGATIEECALTLKRGGAKRVYALVLAHG